MKTTVSSERTAGLGSLHARLKQKVNRTLTEEVSHAGNWSVTRPEA